MQLTEIRFRNISSYGNRWQTIPFDPANPGLYQICGENGTGKSTISQVLKLGLYGKVQGKTIAKCVNRINKSGEIEIVFQTRLGKVDIRRTFLPNKFNLKVGGKEYEQAGVKNVQEYLEDALIGIPQNIFNNTVSLSINDFKSFLKMSPGDKREIVDRIFGLEIINKMREALKDELRESKNSLSKCEDKIRFVEDNIQKAQDELTSVEEKVNEDLTEKTQVLKERQDKLIGAKAVLEEKKNKIVEGKQKIEDFDRKIAKKENELKSNIDSISRQKRLYESDKCPTCGSPLDSDEHKHKYQELIDQESSYRDELEKIREKSIEVDERANKAKVALRECDSRLMEVETKFRTIRSQLKEIEASKVDQQTEGIRRIIDQNKKKMDELQDERKDLMKRDGVNKLVDEILGDKGLKKSVMEHIVKPMNTQVNGILQQLELPFKVEFDGQFDAKLTQLAYDISFEELSTGQQKLLDFSVLLAIIKMLKLKFPTLNILFLDEIFSSLDQKNISRIVRILRHISQEYSMNIMVINHAPLPTEMFDWTITTELKDNFSNLVVEKCA